MHPSTPSVAALVLASATLAACGGDVPPEEMVGFVIIQTWFDAPGEAYIRAFVGAEDPPDASEMEVTVNEHAAAYHSTSGPGSDDAVKHVFDVTVPTPAPGAPYEVSVTAPGGSATMAIPMVQAASLIEPGGAAELERDAPLDVAWSAATPEERDVVLFQNDLYSGSVGGDGSVEAAPGATSLTIPAEVVATWRADLEQLAPELVGQPIDGELVLVRTRSGSAQPALGSGSLTIYAGVARQPVTLLP